MIPKGLLPPRPREVHKGDCGRVLILAGSASMTGAAALCAMGALRAGAGLVTLGIPKSLHAPLAAKLTEAMFLLLPETSEGSLGLRALRPIEDAAKAADVVAIGPGLSRNRDTAGLVQDILPGLKSPVILDADALNNLGKHPKALARLSKRAIVTPHPGEMARLTGKDVAEIQADRALAARAFAQRHESIVVLKGAGTVVANPQGNTYINETGNSAMASGGMGDVLTGLIAALVGQRLSLYDAACLGVYLHGLAGDLAAKELGAIGLIASDVAAKIPFAIRAYQQSEPVSRC